MKLNKNNKFIITGIVFAVFYIYLSIIVNSDAFRNIDYVSLLAFQNNISRNWDIPLSLFSPLGVSEITTSIVVIIFLWFLIFKKKLYLSLLLFFLIFIIEIVGKTIIFHPDPPQMFNRYAIGLYFPSSFIVHTNFSFPSGHVARSTFVITLLIYLQLTQMPLKVKRTVIIISLLVLIFIGMAVSRIYLGEHWLSDVIGGFILGSSLISFAIGLM